MTRRQQKFALAVAVVLALVCAATYQLWAGEIQIRTDHSVRATTSSCEQIDRLYSDVITLEVGQGLPAKRVAAMRRQRADRLRVQECPS